MIGVTGTDGKTTTASLIYDILHASRKKVALLTTVSATINGKSYDTGFHVTTPSAFALQKYIALAKKAGVEYFILETTSHGLDQNRVFGIHFAVSVVTNISREHLDYHKTYEKYLVAKAKIMKMSNVIVLNKDDKSFPLLMDALNAQHKKVKLVTYGIHTDSDITLQNYPLQPSMAGEFNTYNSLAALAVCLNLGVEYVKAKKIIEGYVTPEGRQDIVQKSPFTVMIDFAHTPNSFRALLASLRKEYKGKIIHVFGSAGERDAGKRPIMGEVSSQYSDIIVLTSEDPRGESVENINKDIKKRIFNFHFSIFNEDSKVNFKFEKEKKYLFEIPDRKKAIEFGISLAKKGDIVVITGKGHEKSMNFGKGEVPWSDHLVVKEILSAKLV
jgi:UDP-N-acetylmuramoyl-L-alanyl-D-glutamate--2,6-diaminopimelate ligase